MFRLLFKGLKHSRLIFFYLSLYGNLLSEVKMVYIPSGTYTPFLSDKKTISKRKIKIPGFYLDQYPTSNLEFSQFLEKNPKWRKGLPSPLFADETYLAELDSNMLGSDSKKETPP